MVSGEIGRAWRREVIAPGSLRERLPAEKPALMKVAGAQVVNDEPARSKVGY